MSQYQGTPLEGGCLPLLEAPIGKSLVMETYSLNVLLCLWDLKRIALL